MNELAGNGMVLSVVLNSTCELSLSLSEPVVLRELCS